MKPERYETGQASDNLKVTGENPQIYEVYINMKCPS